ncbi:MAG: hypothetical protein IJJ69_10825 [Oscillospiraceae bacterium]|nr:hypothetical protein [Oscillospiraceae bacterium]
MKKSVLVMLLCGILFLNGCSSVMEFSSETVPLATTGYTDYTEITSPEAVPETVRPTFPHKETETVIETIPEEPSLSDELYQKISQFESVIPFDRKLDSEEIVLAMGELERKHPEIFWINGYSMKSNDVSSEVTLKVMNQYSPDELRRMSEQVDFAVEQILNTVNPEDSDYEKALQIHDYLVTHTEYDQSAVNSGKGLWSTAFGCLINGSAVCQGYSQAFQILMNRLGIECGICSGDAKSEPHAWNYIKLNGQYYWVDVTWDDPVSENHNFDWIHHGYFLIDDRMLARSRTFESNGQFVPLCGTLDENYFVRNGNYLQEYYFSEIDSRLTASVGAGRIEVMFATEEAYQMAIQDLFGSESVWNAQIFQKTGGNITYQQDDDMYVLRLIFTVNP